MEIITKIIELLTRLVVAHERSADAHEKIAAAYSGGAAPTSSAPTGGSGETRKPSATSGSAKASDASADNTSASDDPVASAKAWCKKLPEKVKELVKAARWNPTLDLEIVGRYSGKKRDVLCAMCEVAGVSYGTSTTGAELHERLLIKLGLMADEGAADDPEPETGGEEFETEASGDDDLDLGDLGSEDDDLDLGDLDGEEAPMEFADFKEALAAFNKENKDNRKKIAATLREYEAKQIKDVPEESRREMLEKLGIEA